MPNEENWLSLLCCDLMQQQQQPPLTILSQHSCTMHILHVCMHNQHQFSYPMQNNCSCFFSFFAVALAFVVHLNTFRMYVIWAILFSRCVQKSSCIVLTDKMLSFSIQRNYQVDSFQKYMRLSIGIARCIPRLENLFHLLFLQCRCIRKLPTGTYYM